MATCGWLSQPGRGYRHLSGGRSGMRWAHHRELPGPSVTRWCAGAPAPVPRAAGKFRRWTVSIWVSARLTSDCSSCANSRTECSAPRCAYLYQRHRQGGPGPRGPDGDSSEKPKREVRVPRGSGSEATALALAENSEGLGCVVCETFITSLHLQG